MPSIRVAIPAMDELDYLPATLDALSCQETNLPFEVYICVNQPENYWDDPAGRVICEHNRQLLEYLSHYEFLTLHVLDYSSPGKGWPKKKTGVGHARRALFDSILSLSDPDDFIVSMDADTLVESNYLQSVADNFLKHPEMSALAVPYYHRPNPEDETSTRAMLRYEIYMRNYAINLLRINSPYGFTALGSAIVMRAKALRKIGNITPLQSGEDFYLVQKFCKMGGLRLFNSEYVFPACRYSDRVPFGTGPAMKLGSQGVWDSYPVYHHSVFGPINEAYLHLNDLYKGAFNDNKNDFLAFLQKDNTQEDIWATIRHNVSDFPHFVKAFHQKADGLRILQYARQKHAQCNCPEHFALFDNLHTWWPDRCPQWLSKEQSLDQYSISQLNELRNLLFEEENVLRKVYPDKPSSIGRMP
jgi:hypothetical protein